MKPVLIANWKQNVSIGKSGALARAVIKDTHRSGAIVIIAPSILSIAQVVSEVKKSRARDVFVSAQDCGFTNEGAYTGAVSPRDLRSIGVTHVIIGHSERRSYFNEDESLLAKKVIAAREAGLHVIYCVGETMEERNEGRTVQVIKDQLKLVKNMVDIVAYEPRWAIGTGLSIEPREAEQIHAVIDKMTGSHATICYGGSVNETNARAFVSCDHTQGILVGSASATARSWTRITKSITSHL